MLQSFRIFEEEAPAPPRSKSASLRGALTPSRLNRQNSGLGGPSKTPSRKTPSKTPRKTPSKKEAKRTPAKADPQDSKFQYVASSAAAAQKKIGAGLKGNSLCLWEQAVGAYKTENPDATLRALDSKMQELVAKVPELLRKEEAEQRERVLREQGAAAVDGQQGNLAPEESQRQAQAPPPPPPAAAVAAVAAAAAADVAGTKAAPRPRRRASSSSFSFVRVWPSQAAAMKGPTESAPAQDGAAEQAIQTKDAPSVAAAPISVAARAMFGAALQKRRVPPTAAQRALVPHSPSDAVFSPASSAIQGRGYFAVRLRANARKPRSQRKLLHGSMLRSTVPKSPCDAMLSPVSRALQGRAFVANKRMLSGAAVDAPAVDLCNGVEHGNEVEFDGAVATEQNSAGFAGRSEPACPISPHSIRVWHMLQKSQAARNSASTGHILKIAKRSSKLRRSVLAPSKLSQRR